MTGSKWQHDLVLNSNWDKIREVGFNNHTGNSTVKLRRRLVNPPNTVYYNYNTFSLKGTPYKATLNYLKSGSSLIENYF